MASTSSGGPRKLLEDPFKKDPPAELLCPHGADSYRYSNFIIIHRDRIRKERSIDLCEYRLAKAYAQPSGDLFPTREFYPIGTSNKFWNRSEAFAKTFGPSSSQLVGTGNHTSLSQSAFGRPGAFEGGLHDAFQKRPPPPSSSLPSLLRPPAPSSTEPPAATVGNPRLAAQIRNHERLVRSEGQRSGELARGMRERAQWLKRQPRAPPEGKWW
eukprot:TRINITY_DN54375_c0_g1_i1.p1 TRINITY_DN54375_c0_g1~~TRINITY_DN54375_c0_g1_i1.p1  ORF type:complete len:247 (-),score=19.62 TRINITY_DN54375_c0_g1_i1:144-782(-)